MISRGFVAQLVGRLTCNRWIHAMREFETFQRLLLFHWARNVTSHYSVLVGSRKEFELYLHKQWSLLSRFHNRSKTDVDVCSNNKLFKQFTLQQESTYSYQESRYQLKIIVMLHVKHLMSDIYLTPHAMYTGINTQPNNWSRSIAWKRKKNCINIRIVWVENVQVISIVR